MLIDAARDGRAYNGQALQVEDGKSSRTVVLVSSSGQLWRTFSGNGRAPSWICNF